MVVGRAETVKHYAAPRAAVSWPYLVGRIPRQADCFQNRGAVGSLGAAVAEGGTAVLCQVLAGTGGVGKTQLAAHHARTAWQAGRVDLLVWVTAATREAIITSYATAGTIVLGADPDRPEQAAEEFLAWLEPKPSPIGSGSTGCRWMVVLDDLIDPADLRSLWPPADNPLGQTLVTTRRRDAVLTSGSRRRLEVGLFTEAEARTYLTAALTAHGRTDPPEHIHALARDLGRFPLALAQAAAYLNNARFNEADPQAGFLPIGCPSSCPQPCTRAECVTYRKQLADGARPLDDVLPEPAALPDDQAATVAAAWFLSIDRANNLRPAGLARPMLQLTAMLDPNGIPITVLTSPPALTHLTEQRTTHEQKQIPAQVTAEDAVGALRALHRLSLLDITTDPGSTSTHRTVRVHNLIQRTVRDPLAPDRYGRLARTAADALLAAWPHGTGLDVVAEGDVLRANAAVLVQHSEGALYTTAAHPILRRYGSSLWDSGQAQAALDYYRHLADAAHQRLGPAHPDCLAARTSLAHLSGHMGDTAGATAALQKLSEQMLQWLGPDHSRTLHTRYLLAHWCGETLGAPLAVTALEQVRADQKLALGPDDSDTLSTRHLLAHWRREADDAVGAIADGEQLVRDQTRLRGSGHHNTLAARSHLAAARAAAGDERAAVTEYEKILAGKLRLFSPDHPEVLDARRLLASYRWKAGETTDAVNALAAVLADEERIMAHDHARISRTRGLLEEWLAVLEP
ncbi:tetratricopeptide repeat protein [Streptomyces sp. NPDC032198]|uniref:tetratricopeptide repeat protein n=1 Tax=Streptomyces sp. NPDC032198 TaxID=3155127 RepID=UPI00340781F0